MIKRKPWEKPPEASRMDYIARERDDQRILRHTRARVNESLGFLEDREYPDTKITETSVVVSWGENPKAYTDILDIAREIAKKQKLTIVNYEGSQDGLIVRFRNSDQATTFRLFFKGEFA
jgi:hypothetical protein